MTRLLIICTCCCAIFLGFSGCPDNRTQSEKDRDAGAAAGAGDVASLFGIPRPLGESIAGLVLLGLGHIVGHKRGRTCERRRASPLTPKV